MKVQRLQITHQMAKIFVESQRASLSIETKKRQMNTKTQPAQMSVEKENPKVKLDLESFRDNIGLKSYRTLTAESAAQAQANVKQYIEGINADADFIGTLPSKGNAVAQAALSKMLQSKVPEMNSGDVPDGAIKMEGNPGTIKINWSKHDLKIIWDNFQSPVITVEPKASVKINMVQEPSVQYSVVELTIPPESGGNIDTEA
ncbi:hypothetical protein SDC9_55451 [bioreactor metagenome]|uniref:Uncharacterized protein n=1 Tax=bioreactor metagenome TaxID=1076179 RepID=A0A644WYZ4_9ZZZZ